jgi:hypothetical protein
MALRRIFGLKELCGRRLEWGCFENRALKRIFGLK